MKRRSIKHLVRITGVILLGVFIFLTVKYFHAPNFIKEAKIFFFGGNPLIIISITIFYSLSFILRAEAWRLYLGRKVKFYSCLEGVLLSLFVNHITPVKLGDAVRIGVLAWREKEIEPEISAHSVIVLRAIDMFFLLLFSFIGLFALSRTFTIHFPFFLFIIFVTIGVIGVGIIHKFRPSFLKKHLQLLKAGVAHKNIMLIMLFVAVSWVLEGVVVWGVTTSLKNSLPFYQAIWVNSITVGGQIFQITPGGISTYESVLTAALTSFRYPVEEGYMVALISHSYKFLFSYLVGFLIIIHSPIRKVKLIKEILLLRRRQK